MPNRNNPDRAYHRRSHSGAHLEIKHVLPPVLVGLAMNKVVRIAARCSEQGLSKRFGICRRQTEARAKEPGLMASVRMRRGEAIIAEFGDFDNNLAGNWAWARIAHAAAT